VARRLISKHLSSLALNEEMETSVIFKLFALLLCKGLMKNGEKDLPLSFYQVFVRMLKR
jgi:hypothetical protein